METKTWDKTVGKVSGFRPEYRYWIDGSGDIHQTDTKDPNYAKHQAQKQEDKRVRRIARDEKMRATAEKRAVNKAKKAARIANKGEIEKLSAELKGVKEKLKKAKDNDDFEKAPIFAEQRDDILKKIKELRM